MGTFHSAQYFAKMSEEFGDIHGMVRRGDLLPIRDWLVSHVHSKGRTKTGEELLFEATGSKLDMRHYFDYVETKFRELYPEAFA